jgi:hypothetical protein
VAVLVYAVRQHTRLQEAGATSTDVLAILISAFSLAVIIWQGLPAPHPARLRLRLFRAG